MRKIKFNGTQLKLIAIIAMTIDHLAWLLYPGFIKELIPISMHIFGRITAPIMWYFVAEGCYYTKNIKRYFIRLFIFAIISHFAFCFSLGIPYSPLEGNLFNKTSVMFPLSMSILLIWIFKNGKTTNFIKILFIVIFCAITFIADWSSIALMMPFFVYQHRGNKKKQVIDYIIWISVYSLIYILFIDIIYGVLQFGTLLSLFLLWNYDGTRGKEIGSKWFFYYYYPLHLIVIGILRVLMYGNISLVL